MFLGRKDGFSKEPAEILESEGVSLFQTQLVDLDGDGRPDLVVPYTSFGVFALIRMLTAKTAKVDFQIYPFDRKSRKFAVEPVSERELKFRIPLAGDTDLQAVSLTADVTGDGKPDLIFGSSEDQLDIYPALGGGEFASNPAETVEVRAAGVMEAVDLDGKGRSDLVLPLARAAVAAGADGVMVEVHPQPEDALCDGPQQIRVGEFARFADEIRAVVSLMGKTLG